jgi:hypothetical protein
LCGLRVSLEWPKVDYWIYKIVRTGAPRAHSSVPLAEKLAFESRNTNEDANDANKCNRAIDNVTKPIRIPLR